MEYELREPVLAWRIPEVSRDEFNSMEKPLFIQERIDDGTIDVEMGLDDVMLITSDYIFLPGTYIILFDNGLIWSISSSDFESLCSPLQETV